MKFITKPAHAYIWAFIVGSVSSVVLIYFSRFWYARFLDIYSDNLQLNIFQGLLIVVGFLLTYKLFVLVKLQEELYSNESFLKHWAEKFCRRGVSVTDYYKPLRRLSELLIGCIFCSTASAILQVTLGFLENAYTISICIGSAVASIFLLLVGFIYIKLNLEDWFDVLEERDTEVVDQALKFARDKDPLSK